jgi:hypothetical protein
MTEPQTKGMAIINMRNWLDERLGEGWFTRTARGLDPDWPERVLPGDWYPARTSRAIYGSAVQELDGYDSLEELMAKVSGEVALNDLNGILRAFLWVASPKMFLRTSPKIWANYVNFSSVEIVTNEAGHYVANISEIPADLVTWVAAAWRGFLPPALELAGGANPVPTVGERRQSAGAETWEIVYEIRYE